MRYQCDQCEVSYRLKNDIKTHVKAIHEGKPYFQCEICLLIFNRKESLKLHKSNIHSIGPVRRQTCEQCGKSFARSINLREQKMMKHEGKKNQM